MLKTVMVTIINFLKIALVYVLFSGAFIYGMSWLHDHGCLLRDAEPNSVGLTAQIEAQIEALRKAGCPLMRKSRDEARRTLRPFQYPPPANSKGSTA